MTRILYTDVDGLGVWNCLTSKAGVFNPISYAADEFVDPVIGTPVSFHAVLVELAVIFIQFPV